MTEPAGTYEEWRVHGHPGDGYPPYEFVWSRRLSPNLDDPEAAARSFVEMVRTGPERSRGFRSPWVDGPHLSSRTVVISDWKDET